MIQGNEIEISEVDTRFEGLKTRDKDREKKLVGDLSKGDLLTPLLATEINGVLVLLDGFKRLRAAITLKWSTIRCLTVAENEVTGIFELLHRSRGHKICPLPTPDSFTLIFTRGSAKTCHNQVHINALV
jgi:hypothetical protein